VTPSRLQRKRTSGWRKPEGAVIVDRSSRWGNPWVVEHDPGSGAWYVRREKRGRKRTVSKPYFFRDSAAMRAVRLYERLLTITAPGRALAARAREELAGRDLCCWCEPGAPCHADTLLRVANGQEDAA